MLDSRVDVVKIKRDSDIGCSIAIVSQYTWPWQRR